MTGYILAALAGVIAKTLLPWPWADDKVRAAWRWAWSKIG